MAAHRNRGTPAGRMRFPGWAAFWSRRPVASGVAVDLGRLRREHLAEAAVALGDGYGGAPQIERILRVAVDAVARMTRAGAALVLAGDDGRVQRLASHALDGCTRDTLARPDVLGGMLDRLAAAERPLAGDDIDGVLGRTLRAVAPHGIVLVPVDRLSLFVVVARAVESELDEDAVAVVTLLARLASAALERVRGAVALQTRCEELRRLCADSLVRHERDLARTARDLHEGVCQRLAAANAHLEAVAGAVRGQRDVLGALRDARALVNQTLGELRALAQQLRPSVLENLGYVEALRWYVGRLREREGLALALEVEGAEERLPLDMESALYRATEDALGPLAAVRDVRRRLRVRYRREAESVFLEIAGPRPDAVDLTAMRERLRPFGGEVNISASPGYPAVIALHVPAARAVN